MFGSDRNKNLGLRMFAYPLDILAKLNDAILFFNQAPYQNDPMRLMNSIPSEEMWRFFIDRKRQSIGRDLGLELEKLGIPLDDFDLDCIEFIVKYNDLPQIKILAKNLEKMGISILLTTARELIDYYNGWLPFEKTEKGYLQALISQLPVILAGDAISHQESSNDFATKLVTHIKKLHAGATKGVGGNLMQDTTNENPNTTIDNFRNKNGVGVSLNASNGMVSNKITPAAFLERLDKMRKEKSEDCFLSIGFIDKSKKLYCFIIGDENQKNTPWLADQINHLPMEFILADDLTQEKALAIYQRNIEESENLQVLQISLTKTHANPSPRKQFDERMTQLAKQFHEKLIAAKNSPLDKLKSIIIFIHNCELLHPFQDANTRTFSMLLMNELLMNNSFLPVILEDPNRFTTYSSNELLNEVIDGMLKTKELIQYGTLSNEIPTQILLKNLEEDDRAYFNHLIKMIESQRAESRPSPTV